MNQPLTQQQKRYRTFRKIAGFTSIFALCVIMLGAYVRLSDAGLGCPDWPGCYGQIGAPETLDSIETANQAFPERPVETHKAWKEMVHRYFAGALGLLIITLMLMALRNRSHSEQPVGLPVLLFLLVIFQALLGMWTVTLQLKPFIVLLHLLGGFATLSMLWLLFIATPGKTNLATTTQHARLLPWMTLGLILLIGQIMLGGWTSTNYAALACPDFPRCQTQWWPTDMDFKDAFVLWRGLGVNYEFGVLDHPARTAIHMTHRIGAILVGSYFLLLSLLALIRLPASQAKKAVGFVLFFLIAQLTLGVSNIVFHLPLPVAVLHNGTAAILLLAVISAIYYLQRKS